MKTKYISPTEIAAFKAGLTQGRIEGMISYQKHLLSQIQKKNEQLNKQLQEQKGEYITKLKEDFDRVMERHPELEK